MLKMSLTSLSYSRDLRGITLCESQRNVALYLFTGLWFLFKQASIVPHMDVHVFEGQQRSSELQE